MTDDQGHIVNLHIDNFDNAKSSIAIDGVPLRGVLNIAFEAAGDRRSVVTIRLLPAAVFATVIGGEVVQEVARFPPTPVPEVT